MQVKKARNVTLERNLYMENKAYSGGAILIEQVNKSVLNHNVFKKN